MGKDDIEISYKCREPKAYCTQTRVSETEPELKGTMKVATFGGFGAEVLLPCGKGRMIINLEWGDSASRHNDVLTSGKDWRHF